MQSLAGVHAGPGRWQAAPRRLTLGSCYNSAVAAEMLGLSAPSLSRLTQLDACRQVALFGEVGQTKLPHRQQTEQQIALASADRSRSYVPIRRRSDEQGVHHDYRTKPDILCCVPMGKPSLPT